VYDGRVNIVCVVECDTCGKSLITDPSKITLFITDDEISGISVCPECTDPINCILDRETALDIASKGVRVFDWATGLEIALDK